MSDQTLPASADHDHPLRLLVLAFDFPYPANRGGRADIWRRLVALSEAGCEIMLVCWTSADARFQPSASDESVVRDKVRRLVLQRLSFGPREIAARLWRLGRQPSHVAARRMKGKAWQDLLSDAKNFGPDAIWMEGPVCGDAAEKLVRAMALPLFYRSHNIEHLYMARQANASMKWRDRFAWRLACLGLKRYELRLMRMARRVFDCSTDDIAFWRRQGISRIEWLPPLPESFSISAAMPSSKVQGQHDVLFLGNLTTPNNVRGVEFLLNEVLPRVLHKVPDVRVTIAGSHPTTYVRGLLAAHPEVTFLEDVADAPALLRAARVLVNPVRTGSGIHVKALDMLMTDAPIVCSSQGVCGMPAILRRQFHVHDDAASFAAAIVSALDNPCVDLQARTEARRLFSREVVNRLMMSLQGVRYESPQPGISH